MKDFKNENECGNIKTDDEAYEGVLLKTGDDGYRYYSSSSSNSSTSSNGYTIGGSYSCSHCLDTGWFSSTSNCSWCDAWQTNLAPISCTYSYESVTTSGANITISGECGNANHMYIYIGESISSSMEPSAYEASNNISERFFLEPGKTYQVKVQAESNTCGSDFKQFTITVSNSVSGCGYCNNTGWIDTNVYCPHCDKGLSNTIHLNVDEDNIVGLTTEGKAHVPIAVSTDLSMPVTFRVYAIGIDRENDSWESNEASTRIWNLSDCNLKNGTYDLYTDMTILPTSTTTAKTIRSQTKRIHIKCANDKIGTTGNYYNFAGFREENGNIVEYETNACGYVYKNSQDFSKHIKWCVEPYGGAHYYLRSNYSNAHKIVSAMVDLDAVSVDCKNSRNAYISLGIIATGTKMQQCDFGLENDGEDWMVATWSKNYNQENGESGHNEFEPALPTLQTTKFTGVVNMTLEVKTGVKAGESQEQYIIVGTITPENGNPVALTYYSNDYVSNSSSSIKGKFFDYQNGEPCLRFMRFMSLVPKANTNLPEDDVRDYTSLNAAMYNLTINGDPWSGNLIEYAWSVQGANIVDLKLGGVTENGSNDPNKGICDSIAINHQYNIHN